MKIVWLESESLSVPLPRPEFPNSWVEYGFTNQTEVKARIADAQVLIINKVRIGAEELDAAPYLKLIQIVATGTDNVDKQACAERGVVVSNVVNYGPEAVAEHAFACLLQLVRRVPEWQALVHDGTWSKSRFFCLHDLPMSTLSQMTLGILGNGAIGQKLADFARAFGMHVLHLERMGATSVREGYISFEEGLKRSDVLSLHCPLNDQTRGLINSKVIQMMKPGAVLLNTARGALVNFEDLKQAIESGHLLGAALDVLEQEPPPPEHLMVRWQHPRCIITPHIAWATEASQTNLARLAVKQIDRFLAEQL